MKTVPLVEEFPSDQKIARRTPPDDVRIDVNKLKRPSLEKMEPRGPTMKQSLKKVTAEWFEDTSFHGFGNMLKTDSNIIRLAWILVVIASLGYCAYTTQQSIVDYFNYDVNVNYFTALESVSDFPAVTICNLNPFDMTKNSDTTSYLMKILAYNDISPKIVLNTSAEAYYSVKTLSTILKAYVTSDQSKSEAEKEELGFTINDMLVSCYFNGIACTSSDFTYFRSYEFGNCYSFNSNSSKVRKISGTGPESSLTMELFAGVSERQGWYLIKQGVYVAVHNQTNKPLVKNEGFTVQTGVSANIGVQRTFYSKLPDPFSDCRKDVDTILDTDSDYFKYTSNITKYSKKLCYEICFQYKFAIPTCNCSDPSVPVVNSTQLICNTVSSLSCISTVRKIFDNSPISGYCDDYCPLECDTIDYTWNIATATYPTYYYAGVLAQQSSLQSKYVVNYSFNDTVLDDLSSKIKANMSAARSNLTDGSRNIFNLTQTTKSIDIPTPKSITLPITRNPNILTTSSLANVNVSNALSPSTLQDSLVQVTVFYENLRYISIEETQATTSDTLIGIIGGVFGLFAGASFMSFLEVVELFINIIRIVVRFTCYSKKNRERANNK